MGSIGVAVRPDSSNKKDPKFRIGVVKIRYDRNIWPPLSWLGIGYQILEEESVLYMC